MKIKIRNIGNIFWIIALVSLFFQFPFTSLSKFITPCLIIFVVSHLTNMKLPNGRTWGVLYGIYLFYLALSLVLSIYTNASIANVVRFLLILLILPICLTIKNNAFEQEWKIFKIISLLKAILIISIWLNLIFTQDFEELRRWVLTIGAGDIYIINMIPRIQVNGNALFVLAFMIEYIKEKKITPYICVMFLAGLCAGNSAYILGYVVFGVYIFIPKLLQLLKGKHWTLLVIVPLVSVIITILAEYGTEELIRKSVNSNVVRIEQAEVLLDTNLLTGSGLGHAISDSTSTRDYNNNIYFELQTLYIINQIGLIGLTLFYLLTFIPLVKDKTKSTIYLLYLIYTFWNPYCFDSNHLIALVLIGGYEKNIIKAIE